LSGLSGASNAPLVYFTSFDLIKTRDDQRRQAPGFRQSSSAP
jgi:hypothetical protein